MCDKQNFVTQGNLLADDEHLPAGVGDRTVHHTVVVVEDPQPPQLVGELVGLGDRVAVRDADEHAEPGPDRSGNRPVGRADSRTSPRPESPVAPAARMPGSITDGLRAPPSDVPGAPAIRRGDRDAVSIGRRPDRPDRRRWAARACRRARSGQRWSAPHAVGRVCDGTVGRSHPPWTLRLRRPRSPAVDQPSRRRGIRPSARDPWSGLRPPGHQRVGRRVEHRSP